MKNKEEIFKVRLAVVFYLVMLLFIVIFAKLFMVQVIKRSVYLSEVEAQINQDYDIIRAERGQILDRNGKILAFSQTFFQLDINPSLFNSAEGKLIAEKLPSIINISKNDLNNYLKYTNYVMVSQSITLQQKEKIEKLDIKNGITFTRVYKRVYPLSSYISPIIGVVGVDGEGLSGIEYEFESQLKGKNGRIFRNFVSTKPILPGETSYSVEPQKGADIILTIDENIQYKAQSILEEKVKEVNAKGGSILVINPKNGEILAMANYPTFDPTNIQNAGSTFNRAVNWNYEPGSVIKPIVAAAALEEESLKIDDVFYCNGYIKVKDRVISCWQKHGEEKGLKEILKNSCDVAFAQVGLKLGKDKLLEYYKKFGFGSPTGVELPGEEKGILLSLSSINEVELATMSFGQGIAVTPLQLLSAFSAIANGGVQVKPTILKSVKNGDENVYDSTPIIKNVVISQNIAETLKEALVYTVNEGIKNARIEGIDVLGKTGTAQKVLPSGGYSKQNLIYSFLGAFPAEDPEVAILVVIDETPTAMYSINITPPVFKELAEYLIKYLRLSK